MSDSNDTLITDDIDARATIERIQSMSPAELMTDIFRHEKEVRGIDWLALMEKGTAGIAEGRQLANTYLARLQNEFGVTNDSLDELKNLALGDSVQTMPAWAINQKEADEWKAASGDDLAQMVAFRLKIMQSLELSSSTGGFAQIGLTIGVVAWVKRAYDAYKIARAAGMTSLQGVVQGIRAVTLNASKVFLATVVVAIIAEVLLFLMEKKAVVYTVLVNMTDDDLVLNDLGIINGKQLVQFVDPLDAKQRNALNKRTFIELPDGNEVSYWVGLFAASKRDMALIGSLGAYGFAPCPSFPASVYVGWEIPLTGMFGGPNRCLVSASRQDSARRFAETTSTKGKLESSASSAVATVRARMHSGSGSEGYMSVIFEKKP